METCLKRTKKFGSHYFQQRFVYTKDNKDTLSTLELGRSAWSASVLHVLRGTRKSYSKIDFIGTIQSGLSTDPHVCHLNTAAKGQPDVQGWYLTSLVTAMTSFVTLQFTITEIASPQTPPAPPNTPMQFHCSLSNELAYILFCSFSISTSYKQHRSRSIEW